MQIVVSENIITKYNYLLYNKVQSHVTRKIKL